MKVLSVLLLVSGALAAEMLEPTSCVSFPCLIFNEEFDTLDHDVWEHEITLAGGGNFEFQAFLNNRSVSYTRDSLLYIKPQLVSDWKNEDFLTSGELNLWGMNGRGDVCTANQNYGCDRFGDPVNIINPIMSARLRTLESFAFKYGRVEVKAKMPRGDWLWPAVWMLPQYFPYGAWPASGEIDILESRGNDKFGDLSNTVAGTTLHWGPFFPLNFYEMTASVYPTSDGSSFADDFHVWRVDWTSTEIKAYLDDELQMTIDPVSSFFDFAGLDDSIDNPWISGSKMAPFDQKFYLIINLAVGGTGGFFSDDVDDKPWSDTSPHASLDFWNAREEWLPTWQQGEDKISEKAALQVDYIKVWKMTSVEQ